MPARRFSAGRTLLAPACSFGNRCNALPARSGSESQAGTVVRATVYCMKATRQASSLGKAEGQRSHSINQGMRTRQRPAWPGRCEIATTCGRLRWVPLTSHLKHPNPAPMTLSSTTIRLSKYNNQSRHSSPNLNLDRFAWRSSLSKLAVLSSIPFFFLSRYPYRPILLPSRSHLYTPFSLGCSRDRAPPPQSLPRPPRLVTYASAVS